MKSTIAALIYQALAVATVLLLDIGRAWRWALCGLPLFVLVPIMFVSTIRGMLLWPGELGPPAHIRRVPFVLRHALKGPWLWLPPATPRPGEPLREEEIATLKRQAFQFFLAICVSFAGMMGMLMADGLGVFD